MKNEVTISTRFSNELNQIFENAAILLMLVDNDGRVANINRSGTEMTDKNKEDVLGLLGGEVFNCINAWHNGLPVCGKGKNCGSCSVRNLVNDTFTTGKAYYQEEGSLSVFNGDKTSLLHILISTSIITTNQQKYVLITIDDITKLKQQEKELKDLMATKEKLFSIIAHDLKNPFYSIIGFTEILLKNLQKYDTDKIENLLKIINKTGRQTYTLLEDLLLWTKLQSGKLSFEPEIISANLICIEIIGQLKNQAIAKNISVNYLETDEIAINADLNMLKTILRNLISNAIKFTHENGEIDICVEKTEGFAVIVVSDNGIGIENEKLENFWNLSRNFIKTGTTGEKGGGLGLLLCKEFVEKHSGKIWVESEFGTGSSFKFTMPLFSI
jgi:two-component system, sensor histidine kinase and response regulator